MTAHDVDDAQVERMLEVQDRLVLMPPGELLLARAFIDDLLLVHGTADDEGDELLAQAAGVDRSTGDEHMDLSDDAKRAAGEAGEALLNITARRRRAMN
jgi:hypothetical protein